MIAVSLFILGFVALCASGIKPQDDYWVDTCGMIGQVLILAGIAALVLGLRQ